MQNWGVAAERRPARERTPASLASGGEWFGVELERVARYVESTTSSTG